MSKHEHIYGSTRTFTVWLSGGVTRVDKFYCIDCDHKPNYKTQKRLRGISDGLPADVSYFVVSRYDAFKRNYVGFRTTKEKFNKIMRDRLMKEN